jgi:hypothetical protein
VTPRRFRSSDCDPVVGLGDQSPQWPNDRKQPGSVARGHDEGCADSPAAQRRNAHTAFSAPGRAAEMTNPRVRRRCSSGVHTIPAPASFRPCPGLGSSGTAAGALGRASRPCVPHRLRLGHRGPPLPVRPSRCGSHCAPGLPRGLCGGEDPSVAGMRCGAGGGGLAETEGHCPSGGVLAAALRARGRPLPLRPADGAAGGGGSGREPRDGRVAAGAMICGLFRSTTCHCFGSCSVLDWALS